MKKLSTKHIIIIVLLVMHVLPMWIFKYFPTQDGSSHIYNAYVLKEYHKHENYKIREVFKLNLTVFPNWAAHAIITSLMYVFPPIVCEKILLSICIVALPLSLFYFLNAVDRGKTLFGFLGFIYAYNYLLHMGFYSFTLSMPMFFFTLGYWWKHKDQMRLPRLGILYVLLLCTYLCHYQSYLQLVLAMSFFAFFWYIYSACVETWGSKEHPQRNGSSGALKAFAGKLKPLLLFLGVMLPVYFITFSYYLSSTVGYEREYRSLKTLKEYFFGNKSLVYYRDEHILIMRILLVFLAIAFLLTLYQRVLTAYRFRRDSASTGARLWTRIVNGKEQFLIMAGILTIIYFKAPHYVLSGGSWINDRVHLYIFLIILPFFSVGFHRYVRHAMAGIMIALSLWHVGYTVHDYYYLNKEIADLTSGVGMLEENTTMSVRCSDWRGSDYLGNIKYLTPFGHAASYYCLENGVAYLPNYEADYSYFPINFKGDYSDPADYVLTWWAVEPDDLKELENNYELIHSGKHVKLYHLPKAKLDKSLWDGRKAIKFDMQPHDGLTAPEHIPVFSNTVYTDGKYGWATVSVRDESRSEVGIPEPYRDGVWGEEDGVFRVALPNGTYKVTCYFFSGDSGPYEINIIANGERKIKNFRIPIGNYTITITDERLTQVIYTRQKRPYKRWGWSGCVIAQY